MIAIGAKSFGRQCRFAPTLILILALILAGCQGGGYGGGGPAYKEVNYRTGTEGATIEFVQNAPGTTIDEESTFPIQIRLHNQGVYEILPENNEQVYLKINKDNYFIQGKADEFVTVTPLRAKSDAYPNGQMQNIDLGLFKANIVPGNFEKPSTTISVSACYPYKTVLMQDICLDLNPLNKRVQPCQGKESYTYSGQGAPVDVNKVEPDMQKTSVGLTRPAFKITVGNKGGGTVLSPKPPVREEGSDEAEPTVESVCSGQDPFIGTARIRAYLSDLQLDCNPGGSEPEQYVETSKQKNGEEPDVTCIVTDEQLQAQPDRFSNRDNYKTTLRVELDYYYRMETSQKVNIRRVHRFHPKENEPYLGPNKCLPWQERAIQTGTSIQWPVGPEEGECINKCDICGQIPGEKPEFCYKGFQGEKYEIGTGFSCACDRKSFDYLFQKEALHYDEKMKQFTSFKLAVPGDLCPTSYGCCQKKIDCSEYDGTQSKCNDHPECAYCPKESATKKSRCYPTEGVPAEEIEKAICGNCGEYSHYNSAKQSCEKPAKKKEESAATLPAPKEVPPEPEAFQVIPATAGFAPLQYDKTFFYDESPLGSYDFTLSRNGAKNVEVPSPIDGTIAYKGFESDGYGHYLDIQGQPYTWRLAHFNQISVSQGQGTQRGQPLGVQGNSGRTSGPTGIHVHTEIWTAPQNQGGQRIEDRGTTEPMVNDYLNFLQQGQNNAVS